MLPRRIAHKDRLYIAVSKCIIHDVSAVEKRQDSLDR